jgi:hypothetical protein
LLPAITDWNEEQCRERTCAANHGWIPRRIAKNEIEIPPPHGAASLAPDAASGQPIAVDGDPTGYAELAARG